jgi:aquaporin Z
MEGSAWRKYGAEFIGTGVLVLGGVGSAVIAGDRIGLVGISLAFGLALLAMVYAIGPVSGCHVNPAVTPRAPSCAARWRRAMCPAM